MKVNIYKRKDGRYESRISLGKDISGKYRYKSVYARTYKECARKLEREQTLFEEHGLLYTTAVRTTYEEVCNQWMFSLQDSLKESTKAQYVYILKKYLLPVFGNFKIAALTSAAIKNFIRDLSRKKIRRGRKKLSPSTINNIITILKITMGFAEKRFIAENPMKDIHKMKTLKKEQRLSDADWLKIRSYLKNDYSSTAAAISIAVHMGMRLGEICALKRKDVNLENRLLYVQRTVQRVKKEDSKSKTKLVLNEPKTISSRRLIPIPDVLWDKLNYLCQDKEDDDFLLGITREKVLDPRTLQYRFHKYLEKHGLNSINFHQLRHKFAGICIEKKFDVKSLSEILGHSNVNITLNYYVHPTLAFKRRQINMLSED